MPSGDVHRRSVKSKVIILAWGPLCGPHYPWLELVTEREEDLPRIAVISGQDTFPAERGVKARHAKRRPGSNAIADVFPGIRILAEEVVPGADIFLIGQILAVEADRPMVAR